MKTTAAKLFMTCVVTTLALPGTAQQAEATSEATQGLQSEVFETAQDNFWATTSDVLVEEDLSTEQTKKEETPVVGKFAGNIYKDEYFTDSVYYDYTAAFWQGYNMQIYLYANECLEESGAFLNSLHEWSLVSTRRRKGYELWDLFFIVLGTDFNESWYRCFLFYDDITTTYLKTWSEFNDFGDIYLSFIFNMLANSLNIKSQTENMIGAYAEHDTEVFVRSLASILKSVIDFDSYTSVAGSNSDKTPNTAEFYGYTKKVNYVAPKWERQAALDAKIAESKQRREEQIILKNMEVGAGEVLTRQYARTSTMPEVELGNGYKWGARDYVQAPIGLLIGALHALPSDTSGPDCSSNSTSFRSFLLEGIDYKAKTDKMAKAEAFYTSFSFLDEVGVLCQESVTSTLNKEYWDEFGRTWYTALFINIAYNAGFQWVDAINFIYFTPDTVPQNDWGFFVSYLLGDFILRFFYHDPRPQQVQE